MERQHDNPSDTEITQILGMDIYNDDGTTTTLATELSYDASDPYAVRAVFHTSKGPVEWTFGRDLLLEGLVEKVGEGDIRIWPATDFDEPREKVVVHLRSPDGETVLQTDRSLIQTFNEKMLTIVPEAETLYPESVIASTIEQILSQES